MMDNALKRSIELMGKITVGSKVLYEGGWEEVVNITPCEHQHDDEEYSDDICYYCVGKITLKREIKRLEFPSCYCYCDKSEFDDVYNAIEFITKEESML